jgi:type I restriction enzyme S subunit
MNSLIPEGWKYSTIRESSANVSKKYNAADGLNPRYVGLEHIAKNTKYIRQWGYADDVISTQGVFQVDDTLFGKLRPYLAKVSLADFDGICSTDILVIRAVNSISPDFLYRILSSEGAISHAVESSAGNVMPRTSWKAMAEFIFVKPPLSEQQKIAKILTSVDEVIEKTQAQIDKLKDLKIGMMQELLTNGIGHTEFKDSPVGRIPAEWEVVKFDDVATSITCGVAAKPVYVEAENGVPFLSAQNVSNGNVLLTKYKHISPEFHKKLTKNTKPYKGDILYSRVGANYGEAAVIEFDWEFSVYVSLTLIKLSEHCENYFIKYLLNSAHGKGQAQNGVFAGGGVPNLNVAVVKAFYIALPPLEEQIKISKVILSIDRKLEAVTRKLSTLKNNKKALMQDLLTGKVRVKTESTNTEVAVS